MAASSSSSLGIAEYPSWVWSKISGIFVSGQQQHHCIHPTYLFLLGEHLTQSERQGCFDCRCKKIELFKGPFRANSVERKFPNISCSNVLPIPSTMIPQTHLDLTELVGIALADIQRAIRKLSPKAGSIRTLFIPAELEISPSMLYVLKNKFPKVNGISLSGSQLGPVGLSFWGIKNFDFSDSKLTDEQLIQFIQQNPEIESLDISNCGLLTDVGLLALSELKNLKALNAAGLSKVTSAGLMGIPTENLVYLNLGHSWDACNFIFPVNDDFCMHLAAAKNLRYLDLSGASSETLGITDAGIASLAANNPLLESLLLRDIYKGSSDALMQLKNLTHLIELDLSKITTAGVIVSGDVISMLGTMPNLRFLRLTNNIASSDPKIFRTFENSKIEQLWMDEFINPTNDLNEGIVYLPDTIVDLRIASSGIGDLPGSLCVSIGSFTRLRYLWLYQYNLTGDVVSRYWEGNLKQLEELNILGADAQAFEVICRNSTKISNLQIMGGSTSMDYATAKPILTLEHLHTLSTGINLPEQFLLELCALRRPIKSLSVPEITASVIEALPSLSSTLASLLFQCKDPTPGALDALAKLDNLTVLQVGGALTSQDYSVLPNLKKVVTLGILDYYGIKTFGPPTIPGGVDSQVLQWIGQMPAITILYLNQTRFDNQALEGLIERPLKELYLYSPSGPIDDGAAPILSSIKSLEVLSTYGKLTTSALEEINSQVGLFWYN